MVYYQHNKSQYNNAIQTTVYNKCTTENRLEQHKVNWEKPVRINRCVLSRIKYSAAKTQRAHATSCGLHSSHSKPMRERFQKTKWTNTAKSYAIVEGYGN